MQETSSGHLDIGSRDMKSMSGGSITGQVLERIGHPQLKHLSRVIMDYPSNSHAGMQTRNHHTTSNVPTFVQLSQQHPVSSPARQIYYQNM